MHRCCMTAGSAPMFRQSACLVVLLESCLSFMNKYACEHPVKAYEALRQRKVPALAIEPCISKSEETRNEVLGLHTKAPSFRQTTWERQLPDVMSCVP